MKRILLSALLLSGLMLAVAQVKKEDLVTKNTKSPGAETSVTINGKNLWIYYHAPSVRGRQIFGGDGALEPYGKVWRLGADYATVLHTDADLDLNGLAIPKGDYALYADLDNGQWKLIVNKTLMAGGRHIWGVGKSPDGIREGATTDDPATELGRASHHGQAVISGRNPQDHAVGRRRRQGKSAHRMGECDGVGAVHREVAVSRSPGRRIHPNRRVPRPSFCLGGPSDFVDYNSAELSSSRFSRPKCPKL
jgi:hypothetical protein